MLRGLPHIGEYIRPKDGSRMVEVLGVTDSGDFRVLDAKTDLDADTEPELLKRKAFMDDGWMVVLRDAS